MATTIKELARRLKLSSATISLALRNSPEIAEATKRKVRELAAELHYVPNNFGRGLQARRSHLIGYMVGSVTRSFTGELVETVGYAAMRDNYGLLTGWVPDSPEDFRSQLEIMLEKNVDGLLFTLTDTLVYPHLQLLKANGKPLVFCSSYCISECNCVVSDHFAGGRMLCEHLLAGGHRHIAVNACELLPERRRGYEAAAAGSGAHLYLYGRIAEIPELLRAHPEISAVAAYSDEEALKIKRILAAGGISVPRDISLAGYDDLWFAGEPEFALTTVAQPKREVARQSYHRLRELIEGDTEVKHLFLKPELIVRGSVRALAAKAGR